MSKETMNNDYQFELEDLLQDESFIYSVNNPTEESTGYWENLIEEGRIRREDFESARFFIESVRIKKDFLSQDEVCDIWQNIEIGNKRTLKKRIRRLYFGISAAACLAVLIVVPFINRNNSPAGNYVSMKDMEKPDIAGTEEIQLVLSNSRIVSLHEQSTDIAYDSASIKINRQSIKKDTEEIELPQDLITYNQLIVPVGKRSTLTLSDGTKIWVNAGTRVVYPSAFHGKKREIYVDGEIFLEVSHDVIRPFVVQTEKMDIEVLGTAFNVMAYEKDEEENVVLVSGSVKINNNNNRQTILIPNKMYSLSEDGYGYMKAVDVSYYTSWKDGIYKFDSESMPVIIRRLSRYYGKEIVCDKGVEPLKCSGKLDLKDNLQSVLNGLCQTAPVTFNIQDGIYKLSINN